MVKVSISMDEGDFRWLRRRARRIYKGNLSAAVAEGTRLVRHNEALGALLDKLGAPQLSPAELEAVGAELDGRPAPRRRAQRRAS